MNFVLFDLDNCLANDSERLPLIDFSKTGNERYEAYHEAFADDPINPVAVLPLQSAICLGYMPIFITGRPACHRSGTIEWLGREFFGPRNLKMSFLLWMRPEGNAMPSHELKRWFIEKSPYHLSQFFNAFDDFRSVIDMYRSLGIPARLLAAHAHDPHNLRGDHAKKILDKIEIQHE